MGIWSWFFPSESDHLRLARALMAEGKHDKARKHLMRCSQPEAEALYDECSQVVDKNDRASEKKRLAAEGFHGWKIEISGAGARRKKELEALVAQEIKKAGVDLAIPEVDQDAVKAAVARAQRRARQGGREAGMIKLVRAAPETSAA